jgi:polyisoprenoid-binding protein YceI
MRQVTVWSVLVCVSLAGCGNEPAGPSTGGKSPAVSTGAPGGADATGAADSSDDDAGLRVVRLSPENTKLEFVCIHLPPKAPDPRKGGFDKFAGKAGVDPESKSVKTLSVEIDTTTVRTEIGGRLTSHLRTPDFFDVEKFPTASFRSTDIAAGEGADTYVVKGDLTLHGVTRPISFPATVTIDGDKLSLKSSFEIDRTDFGMDRLTDMADKKVSLSVAIDEK